jgi:hypothetical protein
MDKLKLTLVPDTTRPLCERPLGQSMAGRPAPQLTLVGGRNDSALHSSGRPVGIKDGGRGCSVDDSGSGMIAIVDGPHRAAAMVQAARARAAHGGQGDGPDAACAPRPRPGGERAA